MAYDKQEPNPLIVAIVATLLFVFVLISGSVLRGWFGVQVVQEISGKVGQAPTTQWNDLKDASKQRLSGYGWTEAKTVHIPIERAMELTVKDLKAAPAPAPAPTPAPAPAKK